MPYRNLYLSKEEDAFVSKCKEGWIREVIQEAMFNSTEGAEQRAVKEEAILLAKRIPGVQVGVRSVEIGHCTSCNAYMGGMKKCKACGGKVK